MDYSSSPIERARLLASLEKASGAWLQALPSNTIGTLLDDNCFRLSFAIRYGLNVITPHTCVCGQPVNHTGPHRLSCYKSAGRKVRHEMINDLLKRALVTAEIPSVREPSGCRRSDGKRPDGMSLVPWTHGKHLLWDAVCSDTLTASYLEFTSLKAGEAARLAEDRKYCHYSELTDRYFLCRSLSRL